jgi:hypothetical protein
MIIFIRRLYILISTIRQKYAFKGILKHVAKTVAGVNLSDHVIQVIFDLFDENGEIKFQQKSFFLWSIAGLDNQLISFAVKEIHLI